MTYIPDCRNKTIVHPVTGEDTKEPNGYYEGNLKENDKRFIKGFDYCLEEAVDNFFDNDMFGLQDEMSYLGHILCEELPEIEQEEYEVEFTFGDREDETRVIKTYADLIRAKILDWVEMRRDELITSIIDGYGE